MKCVWFSCVRAQDGKIRRTLNFCEEKGCKGEFESYFEGKKFCRNFLAEEIIKNDKNRGEKNEKSK